MVSSCCIAASAVRKIKSFTGIFVGPPLPKKDLAAGPQMVVDTGDHLWHAVRVDSGEDEDERDNVQGGAREGGQSAPLPRHIAHVGGTPALLVVLVFLKGKCKCYR